MEDLEQLQPQQQQQQQGHGGICEGCGRDVPLLHGVVYEGAQHLLICAPCLRTKIMGMRMKTTYDKDLGYWNFQIWVHEQAVYNGTGFPSKEMMEESARIVWITISSAIFAFSSHSFHQQQMRNNGQQLPTSPFHRQHSAP
jgi:hypothetical protein